MSMRLTQISGLVVGIRPAAHAVDVVNPTGGVYTILANDPSRATLINTLKVGDMVTAVVSPAIATSIERESGLRRLFNWCIGAMRRSRHVWPAGGNLARTVWLPTCLPSAKPPGPKSVRIAVMVREAEGRASEPAAPPVLQGDPDQVIVVSGPCGHATAAIKLDGVV